jgi:hypothetical protein
MKADVATTDRVHCRPVDERARPASVARLEAKGKT